MWFSKMTIQYPSSQSTLPTKNNNKNKKERIYEHKWFYFSTDSNEKIK